MQSQRVYRQQSVDHQLTLFKSYSFRELFGDSFYSLAMVIIIAIVWLASFAVTKTMFHAENVSVWSGKVNFANSFKPTSGLKHVHDIVELSIDLTKCLTCTVASNKCLWTQPLSIEPLDWLIDYCWNPNESISELVCFCVDSVDTSNSNTMPIAIIGAKKKSKFY